MIPALVMSPTFLGFIAASVILAVTPGPGVIYIVTRTLSQGRKAGLASVCGIAIGGLGNAAAASIGLAAVLSASATAFLVVKLAGAAYFVMLGIKTLRARPISEVARTGETSHVSLTGVFCDGLLLAALNPKTTLFFAALLPQFINPVFPALAQSLILSCVFVCVAFCTDAGYALTAAALAPNIDERSAWRPYGRYVTGLTLIGLGVLAALAHPHRLPEP